MFLIGSERESMPAKSAMPKTASSSIMKGNSPLGNLSSKSTKTVFIMFLLFAMLIFVIGLVMIVIAWRSRKRGGAGEGETKVIVVQTSKDGGASPPVYPAKSPDYPLRKVPQDYQQVGVLVGDNEQGNEPTLLALFGRKMSTRDRWEYYVASDKFHMWKLPVQVQKRMCDHEFGCEEIYNGDQVIVPDYGNRVFTARIYAYSHPSTGSHL